MSNISPNPRGFRFSLILNQPFFLITTISQATSWSLTFIAQCLAEARYHSSRSSDGSKPTGTPIGIGWFAIFYQLFIFYRVISSVMRDCEYQDRDQLATLVALNVALGLLCSNSAIYAQNGFALTLYGYGWMILAGLNLAWLLYFTSSDRSRLMSLLNPSHQRKQLIRTSINLRRSASYSNPHLPNLASAYPSHYDGAHEITLGAGRAVDASANPDNEKLLNEINLALNHSDCPHMSESHNGHGHQRISLSHQPANPMASSVNPAPQAPVALPNNSNDIKFEQDNQSKPLNYQYDSMQLDPSFQFQQDNHSRPWERHYDNHHSNRVEPPTNAYQVVPHYQTDNAESTSSTTNVTVSPILLSNQQQSKIPLVDRTLLNQAYRQEALRSATNSEIRTAHEVDKTVEPIIKARALYTYKASITDPNEMSFEKGETLEITNYSGKWWQAKRTTGESGIVPSNYFQKLSEQ